MDFLDKKKYINDDHYKFCKDNDVLLNDYNNSSKLKLKCFIENSKNIMKCNKIIKEFQANKKDFLSLNPKTTLNFDYEITFTDFDVINGTVSSDTKKEMKNIEFNNYNDNNNNIYVNENNVDNMANIQEFININDAYLKSLNNDEIKTLQYYTYRGDIFLNG